MKTTITIKDFPRKNQNYKTIIEGLDKGKGKIKIGNVVIGPFKSFEDIPQDLTKEEWLQIIKRGNVKWQTQFCHHGITFFNYSPHGVPFEIGGESVKYPENLTPKQELVLSLYAKLLVSEAKAKEKGVARIMHSQNPVFNKNYVASLKNYLPKDIYSKIKKIDDIGFDKVVKSLTITKEETPEEIKRRKRLALHNSQYYGWVNVDNMKQKFTSYKIDVPGLFFGRGAHPQTGKIKKLYTPKDIIINLDVDCVIPQPPSQKLKDKDTGPPINPGNIPWGRVIHDNTREFVASYQDPITNKAHHKYINPTSMRAAVKDIAKFDKARSLAFSIDKIRETNSENLKNGTNKQKQLAIILWLIDNAVIRVGGEKDESKEAVTIGATTLKKDNVIFHKDNVIELDFVAKDSVRLNQQVKATPEIYKALKKRASGSKTDELFTVRASDVNTYLKTFDKSLTAKVFRTYHASLKFETELNSADITAKSTQEKKLFAFEHSNIEVAKLCNHKRGVAADLTGKNKKLDEAISKTKKDMKGASEKRKVTLKKKLNTLQNRKTLTGEGGQITCTTSKANYIDPRISIAWSKRMDVPIGKIYPPTLKSKYDWAIKTTSKNFKFIPDDKNEIPKETHPKKKTITVKSKSEIKPKPKKSKSSKSRSSIINPKQSEASLSGIEMLKDLKNKRREISKKLTESIDGDEEERKIIRKMFEDGESIKLLRRIGTNVSESMQKIVDCAIFASKETGMETKDVFEKIKLDNKILGNMLDKYRQSSWWGIKSGEEFLIGTVDKEIQEYLKSQNLNQSKEGLFVVSKQQISSLKIPKKSLKIQ